MGNKKIDKIKINTDHLMEALNSRGVSMRELDREESFDWSGKSISRAIWEKEATPKLVYDLAERLDVDVEYLTGEQEVKKVSDGLYKKLLTCFSINEIKAIKLAFSESSDTVQDEEYVLLDDDIKTAYNRLVLLFKNI
jgi:hypothetical protein